MCQTPGAGQAETGPAKGGMELTEEEERLVAIFRALGQRSRFALWKSIAHKCICLGEKGDYCSIMQKSSGLAQSTVSHHLKVLREAGLVETLEEGTWCCYQVNTRIYDAIMTLLADLPGK